MKESGKMTMVLCLTAAVLLGLGWLPKVVFRLMDSYDRTTQTVEMVTPVLELEDEETAEETAMRLLALERDMTTASVSTDLATRTPDEMQEIAKNYADQYLIALENTPVGWSVNDLYLDVQLAIDPSDYTKNALFWTASYVQQGKPYRSVFMHIDDKTGKLLYLNADLTYREFYTENDYCDMLENFANLYFTGLGVPDYGDVSNAEAGMNEYSHYIRYTFADETYDAVGVEFYIMGNTVNIRFMNAYEIRQSREDAFTVAID